MKYFFIGLLWIVIKIGLFPVWFILALYDTVCTFGGKNQYDSTLAEQFTWFINRQFGKL